MDPSSTSPYSGSTPPGSARMTIESPAPGVRLLGMNGVLDSGAGARLLRLIDSQLLLTRGGHQHVVAVVVDVSRLEAFERGGPQALEHARYACARRDIEFAIAGHPAGVTSASVSVRARLAQLRSFPTVEAALHVVADDAFAQRQATTARPSERA